MKFFKNIFGKESPEPIEFPKRIELIKDKLYLNCFLHELPAHNRDSTAGLACLTEGLYQHNQKEILFVYVNRLTKIIDVPDAIKAFVKQLYQFALDQRTVDSGGYTQFGNKGLFGKNGVVYTDAPEHLKEHYKAPTLSMILVTKDEVEAAQNFGTTRVLSMLGNFYRYFPTAYWSDIHRDELPMAEMQNKTILTNIGMRAQTNDSTATLTNNEVVLQMNKNLNLQLPEEGIPSHQPLVFLTALRKDTNACLTFAFDDDENGPAAISPEGSNGSVLGGCILVLLGQQPQFKTQTVEDGFITMLTDEQWGDFWNAFSKKENINFTNAESYNFRLEWID